MSLQMYLFSSEMLHLGMCWVSFTSNRFFPPELNDEQFLNEKNKLEKGSILLCLSPDTWASLRYRISRAEEIC